MNKDTVYVDINDEITGIIDKVQNSPQKIVALVLPKRASMFQSIVNMKLLKRSAHDAKKNVVLITSEPSILPLAGAVGMHVAKNLQSKPYIPAPPDMKALKNAAEEEAEEVPDEAPLDASKSVGELAGDDAETIEIENNDEETPAAAAAGKDKGKKAKAFKIPNFNKFRMRLFLGIGIFILLVIGLILANTVLPHADVAVKTDTSTIDVSPAITISTAATSLDEAQGIVPAKVVEDKKTESQKVAATGQKDNGTKATGKADMTAGACSADAPASVPAGTGLSTNGLTFITQEAASFSPVLSGGKCTWAASDINIAAQSNGDKYNVSSPKFTVAGRSDVSASSDGLSGGTSVIVKVIAQADVDNAKQQISAKAGQTATDELKSKLKDQGLFAIADTFAAGEPVVTTSANVGDEATDVTVTSVTSYTMWGVNKSDLTKIVTKAAEGKIDKSKQKLLKTGIDDATIKVQAKKSDKEQSISLESKVVAGPELKPDEIKQQIAGKKKGEIVSLLTARPGVKDVTVKYGPFWVSKAPKNVKKINLTLDTPQADDDK